MEVFGYLRQFTVTEKGTAKLVTFTFGANPYFKNAELVKTYTYEEQKLTSKKHDKVAWKGRKGLGTEEEQSTFFSWYEDDTLVDHELLALLELDFYMYPTKVSLFVCVSLYKLKIKFYEDDPDVTKEESDNEAGLYNIEE